MTATIDIEQHRWSVSGIADLPYRYTIWCSCDEMLKMVDFLQPHRFVKWSYNGSDYGRSKMLFLVGFENPKEAVLFKMRFL